MKISNINKFYTDALKILNTENKLVLLAFSKQNTYCVHIDTQIENNQV